MSSSSLEAYGYGQFFASPFHQLGRPELTPARVVAHLGSQLVIAGAQAERAEPSGRLWRELADEQRPTVGDWVAVADGGTLAIIHAVLPRRSVLIRRAAGTRGEAQAVAANVDTFLVVTSANRDANERRLERYLAAIAEGGADAVVVVNKIDLCSPEELDEVRARLAPSLRGAGLAFVSAATGEGLASLAAYVAPGRTIGLVGMSGVGKSSLLNRLLGEERQSVLPIDGDDRGRHSTTRRELVVLPGGGLVVDTPGMRSFGLVDDDYESVAGGFDDVLDVAARCRFRDCTHRGEPGCAVDEAIAEGELDPARIAAYDKLEREAEAAAIRRDPALAARAKRRWKSVNMAYRERAKHDPKLGR